ncbi:MAG: hypothetical protein AB7T06_06265 [Kofleriaceae bacterium]
MATFDISVISCVPSTPGVPVLSVRGSVLTTAGDVTKASDEPAPHALYVSDSTRMRANSKALRSKGLGSAVSRLTPAIYACFLGVTSALADPTTATRPDPPPRTVEPAVPAAHFRPSWDLDGTYLWIGPLGAASYTDGDWDSTVGGQVSIIRVRERRSLGAIGASFGASMWTARGGGRLWLDAIAGTRLGKMIGVSAGPILELSDERHPHVGGSVGAWAFLGVTPFARVGFVEELGGFAEVGLHIALPAIRR